jgi:molecular chaperone GrpE (heat shock protein)
MKSESKIWREQIEEAYEEGKAQAIKEILEIIDNMHEIHIHTTYPCKQTKCSEPKKCYANKKLQELKSKLEAKK